MRVKLENLVITSANPRITAASETSLKALIASLGTHGLIQPLVVRPLQPNGHGIDSDGKFEVIAGSRRLEAARALGWPEVECVENDAEYGVSELGAAENMIREAMHPLDECRVISRLVADGEPLDAVAGRFGQSEKWVSQRIRLNDLCGEVQDAFRAGEIGIAAAQAFTLGDHDDQKRYLKQGLKSEWMLHEREIRAHFQKKSINAKNALFALSDYPQDKILSDLFGDEGWCEDRAVFDRMQRAAMLKVEAELTDKEGWGKVVVLTQGPDYKVSNQYIAVEGRILKGDRGKYAVIMTYTPASGSVTIQKGMVLRKEASKIKAKADAKDDTAEAEDVPGKTADDLSPNQLAILGALQTRALEVAISGGDLHIALQALFDPLLGRVHNDRLWWSGAARTELDYTAVNAMLVHKLEPEDDAQALYKLPTRSALETMQLPEELIQLLCNLALRSLARLTKPEHSAALALKAGGWTWMRLDEGFLKRYRSDALEDLARRLKVESVDGQGAKLSKANLIHKVIDAATTFDPGKLDRILDLKAKDEEE